VIKNTHFCQCQNRDQGQGLDLNQDLVLPINDPLIINIKHPERGMSIEGDQEVILLKEEIEGEEIVPDQGQGT